MESEHIEIVEQLLNQIQQQQQMEVEMKEEQHHPRKITRGSGAGRKRTTERGRLNRIFQPSKKQLHPLLTPPQLPADIFGMEEVSMELKMSDSAATPVTYSAKAKLSLVQSGGSETLLGLTTSPPVVAKSELPPMCGKCEYYFVDGKIVAKGECHHQHKPPSDENFRGGGSGLHLSLNVRPNRGGALLSTPSRQLGRTSAAVEYYHGVVSPGGGSRNRSFYNRKLTSTTAMTTPGSNGRVPRATRSIYCSSSSSSNVDQLSLWPPLPTSPKTAAPVTHNASLAQTDPERWAAVTRAIIDEESCSKKMKTYGRKADVVFENGELKLITIEDKEEDEEEEEELEKYVEISEKKIEPGEVKVDEEKIDRKKLVEEELNPKVMELFKRIEAATDSSQLWLAPMPKPQQSFDSVNLSTFIKTALAANNQLEPTPAVKPLHRGAHSGSRPLRRGQHPSPFQSLSGRLPPPSISVSGSSSHSPRLSPGSLCKMRAMAKTFKTIEIGDWKVDSKPLDLGSIDFEPLGFVDFDGRNVALYKSIAYVNRHRKRFIQPSLELLKMLLAEEVKRDQTLIYEDDYDCEESQAEEEEGNDLGGEFHDRTQFDLGAYYERESALTYEKKYAYSVLDQLIDEDPELARHVKAQLFRFPDICSEDCVEEGSSEPEANQAQNEDLGEFNVHEPFMVGPGTIFSGVYTDLLQQRHSDTAIVVSADKEIRLPEALVERLRHNRPAIREVFLRAQFVTEVAFNKEEF